MQDMAGADGSAGKASAQIETTASDGWHATVALHGEIDIAVAPALHAELQRHIEAGRCFIRIDAAGLTFVDSSALNALVRGTQGCAEVNGALILTNVPTRVRRVIEITGLDTVLLIDTACDSQARDMT
jgi:anti-sigma B factor antagonist